MYSLLKTQRIEPINKFRIGHAVVTIKPKHQQEHEIRQQLIDMHKQEIDVKTGGLKGQIKYLDIDSIEYAMRHAKSIEDEEWQYAITSLNNSFKLLDPVWGGIYQYSTIDWDSPHHCKSMANQTGYLRLYAMAYEKFNDAKYLYAAQAIIKYIRRFLMSSDGLFYCKQDDRIGKMNPAFYFSLTEKQRQAYGMPEVDKHIYTRENGWAIEALASFTEKTGDKLSLHQAICTARSILNSRKIPMGGYVHEATNTIESKELHFADTLSMARAMLQLYLVTKDGQWLKEAKASTDFINRMFKKSRGGYAKTYVIDNDKLSTQQIDENISLCRFSNHLYYVTKHLRFKEMSAHCLRYLMKIEVATARQEEAGILLADEEYNYGIK